MSKLANIIVDIIKVLTKIKCILKLNICRCESSCNQKQQEEETEENQVDNDSQNEVSVQSTATHVKHITNV